MGEVPIEHFTFSRILSLSEDEGRTPGRLPPPIDAKQSKTNIPGMDNAIVHDPVLKQLRTALQRVYGNRLERVVVFGSRARGDSHADSDYDVAVFLRDLKDRWDEFDRLADLGTEILSQTGAFVHAMPFGAGDYRERTPLMHEIRHEGLDL